MIRFLRILVIVLALAVVAGYVATYFMADRIIERVRANLSETLIAPFSPGENDQFGYKVHLHFWPPTVEVNDLSIKAKSLQVDGDIFESCELTVDKILCDLFPLLREKKLDGLIVKGRKFSGLLTFNQLAKRLERTGGALSGLAIDEYNRKARIRGRFGRVSITKMTVVGNWKIDDRNVVTLADRVYYNPDSYVPSGIAMILEKEINFDIRIHILDDELIPEKVSFDSSGLALSMHD